MWPFYCTRVQYNKMKSWLFFPPSQEYFIILRSQWSVDNCLKVKQKSHILTMHEHTQSQGWMIKCPKFKKWQRSKISFFPFIQHMLEISQTSWGFVRGCSVLRGAMKRTQINAILFSHNNLTASLKGPIIEHMARVASTYSSCHGGWVAVCYVYYNFNPRHFTARQSTVNKQFGLQ